MVRSQNKASSETGATLVETGVIIALIAIVALVGVSNFGNAVGEYYCDLYDNPSDAQGDERSGLGWGEATHTWNPDTHKCEGVAGGGCPPGFICNT